MKRLSRTLPFLAVAILAAVPFYALQNTAAISGKIVGRDGTTPAPNVTLQIDSLVTENGRLRVRERLSAKTGRNGEFSLNGLYAGRIRVAVIENGQEIMVRGEAIGDEIFLASGLDQRINFDLSKAKVAAPAAVASAPAGGSNLSAADRDALRKKLEEEAAAAGEMNKAFEAGKTAFAAKNYADAVQNFKTAVDKAPQPMDILFANLGRAYDANKQYEEGEAAYKKAIELKPVESNYHLNLSLIQISMGKMEEGTASIKKAAELNPANAGPAYYNLGATLINRNKPKEAVDPLKRAIELDPKYANAYYQLGLTLIGLNELAAAGPYLQKFVELAPTSPDAATAKALIDATKTTATPTFTAPEAPKATPPAGKTPPAGGRGGKNQ